MKPLTVLKIGGKVVDNPQQLNLLLKAVSERKEQIILVHGGGSIASEMEKKLGLTPQMIHGRRVTSRETLDVVTRVYAGLVNKTIVAKLQAHGLNAIGLSGADGNAIQSRKRSTEVQDFGYVGDITRVNNKFLCSLLGHGLTPIFSAITHDKDGQLLNTNADTLASEIAKALSSQYKVDLVIVFEKDGVLDNNNKLISIIDEEMFSSMVKDNVIHDGMIPKLTNAFEALEGGVSRVKLISPDNLIKNTMTFTKVIN